MVVSAGNDGLATLDSSPQVKLDDVARTLLVEEERSIVDHEARPIDAVRKFVGRCWPSGDEVFLGGILCQRVSPVGCPRHVVDLVGGLKRIFAPCSRLVV